MNIGAIALALSLVSTLEVFSHNPQRIRAGTPTTTGSPVTLDLGSILSKYGRGAFDEALADATRLAGPRVWTERLLKDADDWIDAGTDSRTERRLVVAVFALEVLREWLRGSWPVSERRTLLTVDWQLPSQLSQWLINLVDGRFPLEIRTDIRLAAIALSQGASDTVTVDRDVRAAVLSVPDDDRFRLAYAVMWESLTWPEERGPASRSLLRSQELAQLRRKEMVGESRRWFLPLTASPTCGAEATLRMGFLAYRSGALADALAAFTAVEAKTQDPDLLFLSRLFSGWALQKQRELPAAIAAYKSALIAAPDAQSALISLTAAFIERGDRAAAHELLRGRSASGTPGTDPWREYGLGSFRTWPKLIAALRQHVK